MSGEPVERNKALTRAAALRVIDRCPTEYTTDRDGVRFTVRCRLDAGHAGWHRGYTEVSFAPMVTR